MPARADTKIALRDYLAAHLGGKQLISCWAAHVLLEIAETQV
jgi:hypothetical protein